MCFYVTTTTTSRHFSEEQKKQRIKYYAFIFPFSFYFIRLSSHQIFLCHSYVISFKMSHTHIQNQARWHLIHNFNGICIVTVCVFVCNLMKIKEEKWALWLLFSFFAFYLHGKMCGLRICALDIKNVKKYVRYEENKICTCHIQLTQFVHMKIRYFFW